MNRTEDPTNVIITGVGGQGNVLAARLLASVALAQGCEVTVGDVYGLTQRGGSVASHVRWVKGKPLPPLVPEDSLDILVAFEPLEGLRVLTQFGEEGTVAIVNDAPVMPIGVQTGRFLYPDPKDLEQSLLDLTKELQLVSATPVAQELGNIQVLNTVMMGALFGSGYIPLKGKVFEQTVARLMPQKYVAINLRAFQRGMDLTKGR